MSSISENDYPKFAVVGHPNKGKSSIVASLALDASIQIGNTPGTTQVKRGFPLKVDDKIVYELFDTPGFQRARRVYSWLEEHGDVPADQRIDVVKQFVFEHKDSNKFKDEVELLEPILAGAGVIYVVDASKPYGAEYEVEMEILRWCGQPSMAILNLIGEEDYREEWTRALGQYFRLVRTYNPIQAGHQEHLELLEGMAQLKEQWTRPIKKAIGILDALHNQKIVNSSNIIADYMVEVLSFVHKEKIVAEEVSEEEKERSKTVYREKIINYELQERQKIQKIWNHLYVQKHEGELDLDEVGLFSEESASIFGLSQKELIVTGASAGAITGAGFDLITAGSTLFLGSVIGGVVGGVGAMFGFDNLYEVKVLGQSLGKRELTVGPMQNLNFPYVLLGRSLYHASSIANRSHAKRDDLNLENASFTEKLMNASVRKELEKVHTKLRKGDELVEEDLSAYRATVKNAFVNLLD
ncbi:MAG: Probable integral membrane protein NMA1898 [uncultured Sulfurovum sp.]|uniref:Probable integral membrane protein NMA1898 n=1 Tax=uncultured Sulfurovum sp. TaxID=269237 RepID=A0A6S6SRD1_9BACT|nr:MAG: Probable integral membrane protein NMA1898 [uncultured Sulfurovum sp.]